MLDFCTSPSSASSSISNVLRCLFFVIYQVFNPLLPEVVLWHEWWMDFAALLAAARKAPLKDLMTRIAQGFSSSK